MKFKQKFILFHLVAVFMINLAASQYKFHPFRHTIEKWRSCGLVSLSCRMGS
jgi:hypothetical protein